MYHTYGYEHYTRRHKFNPQTTIWDYSLISLCARSLETNHWNLNIFGFHEPRVKGKVSKENQRGIAPAINVGKLYEGTINEKV